MEIQLFYIGKISGDVYTVKGKYESGDKDDNGMGN